MYTEYVFDDKKYEVASKYLKSILFDIVNEETSKLADIREKIAEADESDLRNKMIELCNRHEINILSILDVSKELNSTLQTIDSFSRDLRNVENESLAEIVSHYVEQQNSLAAEQQNVNGVELQTVNDMNPITDAVETQSVQNDVVDDQNVQTDAVEDQNVQTDNVEMENSEVNQVEQQEEAVAENVTEESPSAVEENSKDESPEIVKTEEVSKEEENTEKQETVASDSNVDVPVIESSTPVFPVEEMEEEKGPEETVPDIFGVVDENKNEVEVNPITDAIEDASENQDVENVDEQQVINNDVVSENTDVTSIQEETTNPVEQIVDEKPISEEKEVVDSDVQTIATDSSEQSQNVIPLPPFEGAISDVNSDEFIDESEIISFIKSDNNPPRAILTSESQITKLRASKGTNESLLTAKQFFKFGEKKNTDSIIDEQPVNDDIASNLNEQQSVDEVVSDSNILPFPEEKTKVEQMEEMMNQITELYNSGKVDEAQALSDKVSELNKELQQNQKVLAA